MGIVVESKALDRLEKTTEVKRFDLEGNGEKRVGLDDVSASVLDTRGKRRNSFRFRISMR